MAQKTPLLLIFNRSCPINATVEEEDVQEEEKETEEEEEEGTEQ